MYCEHCCMLVEDVPLCPKCHGHHLRPMRPDDLHFVVETDYLWTSIFADLLTQHHIPYLTKSSLGAALAVQVGVVMDRVRFLVPYAHLAEAKQLSDDLFAENDK